MKKLKILNLEKKNKQLQKQLNTLNLSIISNEKTYFPFLYEINNFSKTNIQPIKLLNSEEKILELRNIIKDYEQKIYFLEIINQNKLGLDETKLYRIEKDQYLLLHPELKNASEEVQDKRR